MALGRAGCWATSLTLRHGFQLYAGADARRQEKRSVQMNVALDLLHERANASLYFCAARLADGAPNAELDLG